MVDVSDVKGIRVLAPSETVVEAKLHPHVGELGFQANLELLVVGGTYSVI